MATRLRFVGNGQGTHYIDLAKAMSAFHRRMHRSGRYYNVVGGYMIDSDSNSRVDFATAPDHWVCKTAYKRGFRLWKKQRAKIIQDSEVQSVVPKYADFKVFLNNSHGASPLMPVDANGTVLVGGEYQYSDLRDFENNDEFELQLVGPHSGSVGARTRVGLIQSWFDSRPLPNTSPGGDQNPGADPDDDPLVNLFADAAGYQDQLDEIENENDLPPYDLDAAMGNQDPTGGQGRNLQRKATAKLAVGGPGLTYIPSFGAMCGLVEMNVVQASGAWEVVLDIEVGGKIL
jgi:hypothetical protein